MTEIIKETRAKSGYFETERIDKSGRLVKARQDVVVSAGSFSSKEMEKTMLQIAKDTGSDPNKIRIEAYKNGESPMEVNPRHRGTGYHWSKQVSEPTEYKLPQRRDHKAWGGWEDPENPKPFKHA